MRLQSVLIPAITDHRRHRNYDRYHRDPFAKTPAIGIDLANKGPAAHRKITIYAQLPRMLDYEEAELQPK